MKPLVYVAGPYSKPDPVENTRRAVAIGSYLLDTGLVVPYVPHLSMFWHYLTPRPYSDWLALDLDMIAHCQALLRLPGDSPGADAEVDLAMKLNLPIFHEVTDLVGWVGRRQVAA